MSKNIYFKYVVFLIVLATNYSCFNHSDDCCFEDGEHFIQIKSFDGLGNEITNTGAVQDVKLYLFDENYNFIDSILTQENELVKLDYPFGTNLKVVAWGNASTQQINHDGLLNGSNFNDRFMNLNAVSDTTSSLATDLFHGNSEIELFPVTGDNVFTVNIDRKVSCVSVSVLGVSAFVGQSVDNLSLEVNNLSDGLTFNGDETGTITNHTIKFRSIENDQWKTSDFYVIPDSETAEQTSLNLYYNNSLIKNILKDSDGNPINFVAGERYEITVDFRAGLNVTVENIDWNKSIIEQDF